MTQPGLYRLQMHADGIGQQSIGRRGSASSRRGPVAHLAGGAIRVAVVQGARGLVDARRRARRASSSSGRRPTPTLYDVLDTRFRTAAAAVVVDLDTVPLYTLAEMHALLPRCG